MTAAPIRDPHMLEPTPRRIAVVIPAYRVTRHVMGVVEAMPAFVERIYVVDDACPEKSGDHVRAHATDPRVVVLENPRNLGVGGAVMHGYRQAAADGMDVIVKVDGDGQMDPSMISRIIGPILRGHADYTKGNRFYDLRSIHQMPPLRLFGNAVLSFMAKISTGYWDVFDPTNGYTAIDARVAAVLPHEKISERYFFETDILFRLGTFRAVVVDVPMDARYGDEVSNLRIGQVIGEFLGKHARNFFKRVFYNYFLRDLSIASVELLAGIGLIAFGTVFGAWRWYAALVAGTATPVGTVMLAVVPVLVGLQLLLAFLAYDIAGVPRLPVSDRLKGFGMGSAP